MDFTFYDVKTRSKVTVDKSVIKKTKLPKTNKDGSIQYRYAMKAVHEGRKLLKFISKADFDTLEAPEE